MQTIDKNILYTYVPPEIDWEFNKEFYLKTKQEIPTIYCEKI